MGFIGKYKHTLDPKGRIFVPKRLLAALPAEEPRQFTVTKGFDGCLTLYTASAWRRAVETMKSKAKGESESRAFKRLIYASGSQVPIDAMGRILLPDELRAEAKLDRDVMFVGMEDEIELWDLEEWNTYSSQVAPTFEQVGRGMI